MFLSTVLVLLHYFLSVVQSAPVNSAESTLDLTDVTERAKTLVQKVLTDIPVAHAIAVHGRVSKRLVGCFKPSLISCWLSPSPRPLRL